MKLIELVGIIPDYQKIVLTDVDFCSTVIFRGTFEEIPLKYWSFYVDELETIGKMLVLRVYN